jgi:hypothetical protein
MTRDAGATATFTMVWASCSGGAGCDSGVGTNTVVVNPGGGQTLLLNIVLTHNESLGMGAHGVSLHFDDDLANELDLLGGGEWAGSTYATMGTMAGGTYSPLSAGMGVNGLAGSVESTGAVGGQVNNFESGVLVGGLPANSAGIYVVGTARFVVGTAYTDGVDILIGSFYGADGNVDGAGAQLTSEVYGTATVNVIPEPGTVSLLGLGLVGLVLAGRRSRRS